MKSLTHDFDYIDNFVTFCFMLGGVITYKTTSKINNLNRFCRRYMLLSIPSVGWLPWQCKSEFKGTVSVNPTRKQSFDNELI